MVGRFEEAIRELIGEIEAKGREIAELKRTVNFLRSKDGLGPEFADAEQASGVGGMTIEPGRFYGKSPITAAREYLEMRGTGKVAMPDEIVAALERGSFDFKAQGWESENRVRNLAISMGKNTAIFHRLPNGFYGLAKWYPELQRKTRRVLLPIGREDSGAEDDQAADATAPNEPDSAEEES